MVSAALTFAASALLAGAAYAGVTVTALAVLLVQVCLASSWHRLAAAPGARSGAALAIAAGLAADVVLLLDDEGDRIGPVVAVAALVVPVAFAQQIARGERREQLVTSLGASVTVGVLTVALSAAIPLSRTEDGQQSLLVGLAALGVAAVVADLLDGRLLGLVAGAAIGVALGVGLAASVGLGLLPASGIAVGTSVAAVAAVRATRLVGRTARRAVLAVAALPLALGVPLLYVLATVLVA